MFRALEQKFDLERQARNIPIINAVANKEHSRVKILIKNKADVNTRAPGGGKTPLHLAVDNDDEQMIVMLLEAGADVSVATQNGITPLHVAAKKGNKKIIQRLIQAKAPVDARSTNGCTALHEAAIAGHKDAVAELLEAKADATLREFGFNLTAANLADEKKHENVRDFLYNAMNYQQNFIQIVNYILYSWKKQFLLNMDSKEYKFINKLANDLVPLVDDQQVFEKIESALNSPEYAEGRAKLQPLRSALSKKMKMYKEKLNTSIKDELVTALTQFGFDAKDHGKSLDVIVEYCNVKPKP